MFTVYSILCAAAYSVLTGLHIYVIFTTWATVPPCHIHLFQRMDDTFINGFAFGIDTGDQIVARPDQRLSNIPTAVKIRRTSFDPVDFFKDKLTFGTGRTASESTNTPGMPNLTGRFSSKETNLFNGPSSETLKHYSKVFADRLFSAAEIELSYCRYNLLAYDLKTTGNLVVYAHEAYGTRKDMAVSTEPREAIGWLGVHGPYNLCTFMTKDLVPSLEDPKPGLVTIREKTWFEAHQEKIGPITNAVKNYYVGIGLMKPETVPTGEVLLPILCKLTPSEVGELIVYLEFTRKDLESDLKELIAVDDLQAAKWRRLVISGLNTFLDALIEAHDRVAKG